MVYKIEEAVKAELQMTSQENDPDEDFLLDTQNKVIKVLKIKLEIQNRVDYKRGDSE